MTLSRRKQLLPRGVEEAVPSEAVSGRRRRNKPESRSTASAKLPLKSVVTGTEAQGGVKQTVLLLGRLIIYLTQPIQLSRLKRNPAQVSGAPQRMLEVFQAQHKNKKKFYRADNIMFYVSEPPEQKKKKKQGGAHVYEAVITPWLSQNARPCSFHRDQGEALPQLVGGDSFFLFFFNTEAFAQLNWCSACLMWQSGTVPITSG